MTKMQSARVSDRVIIAVSINSKWYHGCRS